MEKRILLTCHMIEGELQRILKETAFPYPIYFIPQDLHASPEKLLEYLQNFIDNLCNVDTVLLSISKCGNGTIGLKASTAQIVLPRCDDCIDLLLSETTLDQRVRPADGCFITKSWHDSIRDSEASFTGLKKKYDEFEAKQLLRMMYYNYKYYYLVDTGTYDMEPVVNDLMPTAEITDMDISVLPGPCKALRKLIAMDFDDDFIVIPKGGVVTEEHFQKN